ncbi:capsular polysaccharide export protein, LipB/KpsS family [Agrobacterium pusense]|uniref:capsular polysaccharide export protein, LipB/KpsS family n=1 Tax=Agrobacterium pusense TaxID=648995 RepID=UPI001C6F092A|nr:capsular biosynthesis protein [Agrobacterium pusense]MBW9059762.1 capsular biosynthesis protein [Agrobacterium pusense]
MTDMKAPLITAIIPIRLSKDSLYDEVERIDRIATTLPDGYRVIIVDYGTGSERAYELVETASRNSAKLVRVETGDQPFSIGAARDIGTQHAETPLVLYHDIDFLMSVEGYTKVIAECRLRDMPANAYAFFALPGIYLTQDFTQKYLDLHASGDGVFADMLVHDGIMRHDKSVYEHHTYAISAIVASKYHLLAIGGHDKSFTGHGAEDFELMHRLSSYYQKGPKTRNYYKNTKSNAITDYEGFRAFYALYGIDVFQRGIAVAHLWHPRRKDVGYVGTNNQERVSQIMRDFDRGATSIAPLEDEISDEFTLVLVEPGTSPDRALRHAYPAFGKFQSIPETAFRDPVDLIDFIHQEKFTRVFFLNPYGNSHRLSLYRAVKAAGIRFIAYDRGALPDSWFFDTYGFLGESGAYHPTKWNHPLEEKDKQKIKQWLQSFALKDETLEVNGARIGADHLRQKLQVGDREVIFVALQRPSDTATVYFSGPCADAGTFNDWVGTLAANIDKRRYVVVVKKHPLEIIRPDIQNVIFADDSTHIRDLIDLASKVVLINSGSGLIAAALGKPVICCGQSFYANEGFAFSASSPEELVALAQAEIAPDEEIILRFMKYLVFDYYSFGKTEYIDKVADDGSLRRLAKRTIYSQIAGLTDKPIQLGYIPKGTNLDAPLFFSFGGRAAVKGPAIKSSTQTKPAPQSKPAPVRKLSLLRRTTVVPAVRPFIMWIGNRADDVEKFNADPRGYFAKLKNPAYRRVGRILFGKPR